MDAVVLAYKITQVTYSILSVVYVGLLIMMIKLEIEKEAKITPLNVILTVYGLAGILDSVSYAIRRNNDIEVVVNGSTSLNAFWGLKLLHSICFTSILLSYLFYIFMRAKSLEYFASPKKILFLKTIVYLCSITISLSTVGDFVNGIAVLGGAPIPVAASIAYYLTLVGSILLCILDMYYLYAFNEMLQNIASVDAIQIIASNGRKSVICILVGFVFNLVWAFGGNANWISHISYFLFCCCPAIVFYFLIKISRDLHQSKKSKGTNTAGGATSGLDHKSKSQQALNK